MLSMNIEGPAIILAKKMNMKKAANLLIHHLLCKI
jgi:hypothetical protein